MLTKICCHAYVHKTETQITAAIQTTNFTLFYFVSCFHVIIVIQFADKNALLFFKEQYFFSFFVTTERLFAFINQFKFDKY